MEPKVIECKAAVLWGAKQPLSIETVQVAPPRAGEVRIKILFSSVCHSDLYVAEGLQPQQQQDIYPIILGHEASGVVESVGEAVTGFEQGDHVLPLFLSQCRECPACKHPRANTCTKLLMTQAQGVMPDGTSRFTCKGQTVKHFIGCSTFSEYTVVAAISLAKIDKTVDMSKVCLLSCGISTGYGAALNTAMVTSGSTCAVWGLGGVGLAAIMGCKVAGAKRIIAVDTNPDKFDSARVFGATDCINPKDHDKPIQQVITAMTAGGADYTFECIGNVHTMVAALESSHPSWGFAVIVGLAPAADDLVTKPRNLFTGRTWKGSYFGGWKSCDSVPKLVEDYKSGKIQLDPFITHHMSLDKVQHAFDLMKESKSIRSIVRLCQD